MEGIRRRVVAATGAVRDVLRNPDIRRLQVAWTLGIAADWALLVTILVAAWDAGGAGAVGLFGLVRMLPSTIVALFVPLPPRVTRDRVILVVNAIRAGGAAMAGAAMLMGAPVAVVFAAGAVVATAGALVRPSQSHLLPALARTPDELIASNVASSLGEGIGTLGGPIVGALLVAFAGRGPTGMVAALAFLVAAIAMAGIRVHTVAGRGDGTTTGRQAATQRLPLVDAAAAFRAEPAVGVLIGAFAAQLFVRGLLTTLLVVVAIDLLGLGEPGVGWLNAAVGAGGFAGSLGALGMTGSRRLAPGIGLSLIAWGLPIALIGLVPTVAVAVAALMIVGVANATLDVGGFTLLQRSVPAARRAAVLTMIEAAAGVAVAVGAVTAPLLVATVGVRGALAISGAILPVAAVLAWPWVSRLDRRAVLHEREVALLRGVGLFELLPLDALERLAGSLVPARAAAGETVLRQGDPGDRYLIVASGALEVRQDGRLLRRVGPGGGVGEIALLRHVPRTASCTAVEDTTLYVVDSQAFVDAVTGHPHSEAAADRLVDERLAGTLP